MLVFKKSLARMSKLLVISLDFLARISLIEKALRLKWYCSILS